MREIKFRAWDKTENRMIGWYDRAFPLPIKNSVRLKECAIRNESFLEYMQYTGLKDKNGKEIYEGDIVEYKDFSGGLVIFGGSQPQRKSVIEWKVPHNGYQLEGHGFNFKGKDCEVIGDIYENPELLK